MRPFKYIEATSLDHACRLLSEYREQAKILAGGQSLLILLKQGLIDPRYLIDIGRLRELEYLTADGDGVAIGALITHRALETSPLIRQRFPILVDMERVVGWVQIRNRGTVCGNLCQADPASDPGTAFMALGAKVKTMSLRGKRGIPLEKFFVGHLETVLEPDEIVVEVVVPNLADHEHGAYVKESVRVGDNGIATAAAVVSLDGEVIKDARIVLGAVAPTPMRANKAERVIVGKRVGIPLDEVVEVAAGECQPVSDIEGSADYKRQIVKVVARQALAQAISRARETQHLGGE